MAFFPSIKKANLAFFLVFLPALLASCGGDYAAGSSAPPRPQAAVSSAAPPQSQPSAVVATPNAIHVELAPFDRYPSGDKFPLVFRFTAPAAPSDRTAEANFAQLRVTPAAYGEWRWMSDSELEFEPREAWHPGEEIEISLQGLVTSDGTQAAGPPVAPETFHVTLPPATVSLGSCEFSIHNRAPLVQYPVVRLRFNYPPDLKSSAAFVHLTLKKGQGEETLQTTTSSSYETTMEIVGPYLFRPEQPSEIRFKLDKGLPFVGGGTLEKGIECVLAADPDGWDKIAESMKPAAPVPPLVVIEAEGPQHPIGMNSDAREPLVVRFRKAFSQAWETAYVAHGKPKGITLDKGLTLDPPIPGVWKTDATDDKAIDFVPAAPWPIGLPVRIAVDQNAFPDVKLKDASSVFQTPALSVSITQAELYTDPQDPSIRQVVATLEFSHAPKPGEIERQMSVRMRVEPQKDFAAARTLGFSVAPDPKQPLLFYIRSDSFDLPEEPAEARFELAAGVSAAQGGAPTKSVAVTQLRIPSRREIFRIASTSLSVVKKNEESLQRVVTVEVTEPTAPEDLQRALEMYVLPDCADEQFRKLCREQGQFGDESLVTEDVLRQSMPIAVSAVPRDEATLPRTFSFSFDAPGKREVFLRVKQGLQSQTRFQLAREYRSVQFVQPFPRDLRIMHDGALLSLSGSRQLGVSLRGVPKVEYELARILPHDVPHLITVTSGTFAKPSFNSYQIGLDQLAERFNYTESFPVEQTGKTYYSSVDFGRFLSVGTAPHGLFVLTVREKKDEPADKSASDEDVGDEGTDDSAADCGEDDEGCGGYTGHGRGEDSERYSGSSSAMSDQRLVLLTDLGLLVKDTLAGEHTVFVMSFRSGEPVAGATVKLLGQNGAPVFTATSDPDGQVHFPSTRDLKKEKVPLVYVVEKGDDYSFLPFGRNDRQLNFSRFETGGVFNKEEAEGLRALVFSDRGIYRPGEESRFGIIVRRRNLDAAGSDLPLEISLRDPRGVEILRRKFALTDYGFEDFRWSTEGALTGTYSLAVYLVRGKEEDKHSLLGSTSFRVDEFQPDKLGVSSRYIEDRPGLVAPGWVSPQGKFEVKVQNLFGTPAVANNVKGTMLVRRWDGTFPAFPQYDFYSRESISELPTQNEDLGELATGSDGLVHFVPDLTRFSEQAFRLQFAAEAFEKGSGRSVVSTAEELVSSAAHFVGFKADGSLDFIAKGAGRKVSLIAVGADLKATDLAGARLRLEQTTKISALVKLPNGTLEYQLTPKVTTAWEGTVDVATAGTDFALKTDEPGDYRLRLSDPSGTELAVVHYLVHGEGNTTFMADRSAEVGIRLSKSSAEPDEEIEVSIDTPYVGAGLLTIERDKVYAAKWFKTDTLSSVQRIRVPRGIVGNAYVSVAFVRSLDSRDIFAPPLSYGVQPFSIARSEYTTSIDLDVPPAAKPGRDLEVGYKTSNVGRVLVYAVDEGILQFARYKNPQPVSSFVPKRALEVSTYQILDLLLPDHKIVEELSSAGGDEDVGLGKFKNPFARKKRQPMAFWSGILPEGSEGTVKIPIPEDFNGTVRVIAVQVGAGKLGVASAQTIAQHDFVIDPQAPYFVSPGDEFEVGATVANTVKGSGKDVKVDLSVTPSAGFEIVDKKSVQLVIPEGEDRSFRLRLRARDVLGPQDFRIEATGLDRKESATETISLRPPQPLRTSLQSGIYRPDKDGDNAEKSIGALRPLYPDLRDVSASISSSPLTVGQGLVTYLKNYPYGCTEQLVSTAFPAVLYGTDPELGLNSKDVERLTRRAFQALSARQRADGSFGLWDATSRSDELFSVYAVHLLLEAKQRSLEVPEAVLARGKDWLTTLGQTTSYQPYEQLAQCYALYLRARAGERVTTQAQAMVSELDRQWQAAWRDTSMAMFLAATFRQLQMDTQANALLKKPGQVWNRPNFPWPLSDPAVHASIYAWLSSKHFDKDSWLSPLDTMLGVSAMIDDGSFTSFSSSFALLGLSATGEALSQTQREQLKIQARSATGATALPLSGQRILKVDVPAETTELRYGGQSGQMYFFGLAQTGFDRVAAEPFENGLTIERELRDDKGEKKDAFDLQDKLEVTLFLKGSEFLSQMAVLELIPGGFEIDLGEDGLAARKSLRPGPNSWEPEFIDVQEDRIVFFGDVPKETATFTYRLKPLSRGKYTFAAPYAEGMYDPTKRFLGRSSVVEVR
jgi:hypothetical protein